MKRHKKLGDLLVDTGLIDTKTLQQALEKQKVENKKIGQILMDMGKVDDIQIAKALSEQLKIPFVRLKQLKFSKEVIALVPPDMAENYLLIPLKETDKQLIVAMANPLEFYALDDLRFVTQKKIAVAVAPQRDILDALEKQNPKQGLEKATSQEF